MPTTLAINGHVHEVDDAPETPLLYVLRDTLHFNGAKFGCGLGQCGACTVLKDGVAIFSCLTPISALHGAHITTIEGLGSAEHPSPLQQAFIDEQAAQCGYCIAGMVMRAQPLLARNQPPTEAEIIAQMQTNLCRCGTHMRIIAAIKRALRTAPHQRQASMGAAP
jgi:nicotinate dehydrogenase subunit A